MKTLLVIAKATGLAAALRVALDPEHYRLLAPAEFREAEPLLRQGMVDAVILDAELNQVEPIRQIQALRRLAPGCPILVYSAKGQWEWEEDAYLLGVSHILSKPVRARLLQTLLDRFWLEQTSQARATPAPALPPEPPPREPMNDLRHTLEVLRDVSGILSHSLCASSLLKQFLLLLREIIGVNRAAIFLRSAPNTVAGAAQPLEDRRLHALCALGIPHSLLEHFELSLEAGVGGCLFRHGRILRRNSEEAGRDREIQKEFELLGAEVAIPVLDRESLVGVAIFDGRLTGESFTNEELSLMFHLLEQLGLAIKNIWLHDQLAVSHEMMADILGQMGSGCVLIDQNLEVLHANQAARSIFGRREAGPQILEFSDLPPSIGSRVFEMMKTGREIPPFRYRREPHSGAVYQVSISPFGQRGAGQVPAVLLLVDDFTEHERAQQLQIESANLRLVATIAEHLSHEIGNALVPISTHQQLIPDRWTDPEFRDSLDQTLAQSTRRIARLAKQLSFLSRDHLERKDTISAAKLVEEAFIEAQSSQPAKNVRLMLEKAEETYQLTGNRAALRHALTEVLINSLQATPGDPQAKVRLQRKKDSSGLSWLTFEVQDNGKGFTEELAAKAQQPFFSTRNVGMGLGLAVTRRILEAHHGKLVIEASQNGHSGSVSLALPLEDHGTHQGSDNGNGHGNGSANPKNPPGKP